ncbi:UDP-glycosyltransferase 73E1-like [Salvia splendens]|uniref:UDP-glycosyltransferase 73E1-like n=1 Tax=Salvia splendens TaxID=180675 RepID=UPI001C263916|nr:UDP-glycosyltransferase 73E1-like [Salvia splendens]
MAGRGHISAVNVHHCTKWLDLHEPGCVIYVALGSLARPAPEQMMELPLALDESNRPFVWGLGGASSPALEGMFVESGFVRRTRDRGFLIHGWAPQLVILSHPAVGGFLTHCGWNSKVEGITAGCLGVAFGEEEKAEVFVAKDAIKGALVVLMEEGAEMRVGELSLHNVAGGGVVDDGAGGGAGQRRKRAGGGREEEELEAGQQLRKTTSFYDFPMPDTSIFKHAT